MLRRDREMKISDEVHEYQPIEYEGEDRHGLLALIASVAARFTKKKDNDRDDDLAEFVQDGWRR